MKKIVVVIIALMVIFMLNSFLFAAEAKTTISKASLKELVAAAKELRDIKISKPIIKMASLDIVEDVNGKIYIPDSIEVKLSLDKLSYSGNIKTVANVKLFPKAAPKKPFISRFGIANVAEQKDKDKFTELNKNQTYITFKIIPAKISLEALANRWSYGLGISHRLSPNTKIIGGFVCKYTESPKDNKKAFLGVGFNF